MQHNTRSNLCSNVLIVHGFDSTSECNVLLFGSELDIQGPYATHFEQTSLGGEFER
jgi:hypothetical protein